MSYELLKPYTQAQRMDFIVQYNHCLNLKIEETDKAIYALEANEIIGEDGVPCINPNYEKEQKELYRQEMATKKLTKREVFLALYKDKGITPEQIRASIHDTEALIEFDYANEYYRGNPLIETVGKKLGYTAEDLDRLFNTGSLNKPVEDETLAEDAE
jgi:hypothetical protein